ncbi:uncharacterized protein EI97DRAFT_156787 [Westerdykella ornata]|uniref:Uncharacterized protein n=1 Tax=Westerdykella ornata TaxID=318751 RepID=A0A6A6JAJ0_WESOR|nr:uncharacterized protein EI97DRAFT_156787 [Westerdykella ornata]KAF2273422.1 hypothetical protein EI97DRAFT_156787 [Westerdykella ornata]
MASGRRRGWATREWRVWRARTTQPTDESGMVGTVAMLVDNARKTGPDSAMEAKRLELGREEIVPCEEVYCVCGESPKPFELGVVEVGRETEEGPAGQQHARKEGEHAAHPPPPQLHPTYSLLGLLLLPTVSTPYRNRLFPLMAFSVLGRTSPPPPFAHVSLALDRLACSGT